MTTTDPARVPAGVRTGGQFAAGARAEAQVDLAAPSLAADYLTALVSQMGIRGAVTVTPGSDGWADMEVTSSTGDTLTMRARTAIESGRESTSALSIDFQASDEAQCAQYDEIEQWVEVHQDCHVMRFGSLFPAAAQVSVRSAALSAGIAQAARGRFRVPAEAGMAVRLYSVPDEPSWQTLDDAEYGQRPVLTCEVDGDEVVVEAHPDSVSMTVGGTELDDAPLLVRTLVSAEVCRRLGIDPGADGVQAVADVLRDLHSQARTAPAYTQFFG